MLKKKKNMSNRRIHVEKEGNLKVKKMMENIWVQMK